VSALGQNGSTRRWREIRLGILRRDDYVCHWCAGPANSVDHLVPRVEGGTDDAVNLVAACQSCNSRRGLEWVRARRRNPVFNRRGGPDRSCPELASETHAHVPTGALTE
jgi:5-methylcytosine-specific restriction endonuclease McrA